MKNNDNKKKNTAQNQADKKKKPTSKVVKTAVLGTVLGLFSCAIVGLSVALYYAQTSVNTHEAYQRQMDAIYQRAYYDLLDGASDLGINLRKIGVSNSKSMQQSLLYEVWSASELASSNLATFKSNDDGVQKSAKVCQSAWRLFSCACNAYSKGRRAVAKGQRVAFQNGRYCRRFSKVT